MCKWECTLCNKINTFTDFVQGYPQRKRQQRRPENLLICWFQGWNKSSALIKVVLCLIYWFNKERNKPTVAGNHEHKETDSINFSKSSLKSHHLWVTLYMKSENSLWLKNQVSLLTNSHKYINKNKNENKLNIRFKPFLNPFLQQQQTCLISRFVAVHCLLCFQESLKLFLFEL